MSDSRTIESDASGTRIAQLLGGAGHVISERRVVTDDPEQVRSAAETLVDHAQAVLISGGTGIAPSDRTFEVIDAMVERPLPGFGELFRMLSYEQVGSAAMLSRACAGICRSALLVSMPGALQAVELAMERLVLPELGHVCSELGRDS